MIKWIEYYSELRKEKKETVNELIKILDNEDISNILELGSGSGITTRCLVEKSEAFVLSVDYQGINEAIYKVFKQRVDGFEKRVEGTLIKNLEAFIKSLSFRFTMVFISSGRDLETTKNDLINSFEAVRKHDGSIVIENSTLGVDNLIKQVVKLKESSIKELKFYKRVVHIKTL